MTKKTLSEAAKEVLDASRSSAREPMHKLADTGSGLDSVRDIGGSSYQEVESGAIGSKSAAGAPSASEPGTKPDAGSKEPMHVQSKPGANTAAQGTNKVDFSDAVGTSTAGHELAQEEIDAEAEETARKERMSELQAAMKAVGGVKEDMDALFGTETLSEEFKTKATTIFEAAVLARAMAVVQEVEKQVLEAAEQAVEETRTELAEQIDNYLNLMVPEWVKQNEVAIESGLRAEVVESFISGMKNLFAEHYVEIPAEKADLVAQQAAEIEELTAKVNEALNSNAELTKKINEAKKLEILNKVCEGLTATQAEKVKTLAEGVEFVTADDYLKKVEVLKEGYASSPKVKDSKSNVVALTEAAADGAVEQPKEIPVSPAVAAHLRVLR